MARSYSELMGLEFEAERLVRSGESRAEVSRRLGVHPQTLATWALRGSWRKKDLDLERSGEASLRTLRAIRDGNRAVDAQREMRAKLADTMREAVALLADGGEEAMGKLERMLSRVTEPKKLYAPPPSPLPVRLGPDPKMGHMTSLGSGDIERKREPILMENGEEWTPEVQRRMNREMRMGEMRPARAGSGRRKKKENGDVG